MAKIIVEKYKFGWTLSVEEKRGLIQAILNHSLLSSKSKRDLSRVVEELQKYGFSEQEAYAIVMNLGANGMIINEQECSYSSVLNNTDGSVFEKISARANRVEKEVKPFTIIKTAAISLNAEDKQRLKSELEELGIQEKELEDLDDRVIYIAKRMAEKYLKDGALENIPLEYVVRVFMTMKFQPNLHRGRLRIKEIQFENKLKELKKLDELISEFVDMGIDKEYLITRKKRNLRIAKKIMEEYRFERELTGEEKRALVQIILDLDCYHTFKKYEKKGTLDNQTIYEIIINYGVHHKAIVAPVTEATLATAVDKAQVVMSRAVYTTHGGLRWRTSNPRGVRQQLEDLVKEEGRACIDEEQGRY